MEVNRDNVQDDSTDKFPFSLKDWKRITDLSPARLTAGEEALRRGLGRALNSVVGGQHKSGQFSVPAAGGGWRVPAAGNFGFAPI